MRACKTCQAEIERGYYCQPCMVERNKAARRKYASKLYDWYVEPAPYNAVNEIYTNAEIEVIHDAGGIFRRGSRFTGKALRDMRKDGNFPAGSEIMLVGSGQMIMLEG